MITEKDEENIEDTQGDYSDIKIDLTLLAFSQKQSERRSAFHTSNKYVNLPLCDNSENGTSF